jgi:LacI family transcriptional regulator
MEVGYLLLMVDRVDGDTPEGHMTSVRSVTRAATIFDVAKLAGVSPSTASRAFNGSSGRRVKASNQERVLQAARQLNYAPNASAQMIKRGGNNTVALLISELTDPYFMWIAEGAMGRAEQDGLHVTIAATRRDPFRELELVRFFHEQRVRMIILAGSRQSEEKARAEIRAVLCAYEANGGRVIDVSESGFPFDSVSIGNYAGARELAYQLLEGGHRTFRVLAGSDEPGAADDRLRGFRDALVENAVSSEDIVVTRVAFDWNGGRVGIEEMDDAALERTDVVFAVNDSIALGALSALRERGMRVPQDIALAGYDDIASLRDVTPRLTTVHIPLASVGATAVDLGLTEPQASLAVREILPSVVLRESTARTS